MGVNFYYIYYYRFLESSLPFTLFYAFWTCFIEIWLFIDNIALLAKVTLKLDTRINPILSY